ncbi:MAG: UDP-N-acetylglucosamine--N-acetylmuramyl-(pentapeptide) pyrophosphoryl-undecaprenol N-acetylglucosamine transferase, partial [Chitinophagaceae bacterium]
TEEKKTVLCVGGSLGAKSINEAVDKGLDELISAGNQVIWQTGKPYSEKGRARGKGIEGVYVSDFITEMEYAYAAADVVVSRSGAMALSELCVVRKPAILVPFPFAAEDHQTANAKNLVSRNAAIMIADNEAADKLITTINELMLNSEKQEEMKGNLSKLAVRDADKIVAEKILRTIS